MYTSVEKTRCDMNVLHKRHDAGFMHVWRKWVVLCIWMHAGVVLYTRMNASWRKRDPNSNVCCILKIPQTFQNFTAARHTCEFGMSHSHLACHICECGMSHTWMSHERMCIRHFRVKGKGMCRVTHLNQQCNSCESVMLHKWMCCFAHVNALCHMLKVHYLCFTHANQPCQTSLSHVTHVNE